MTRYVVLAVTRNGEGKDTYHEVGATDASSTGQALRKLVAEPGRYVAVPARMFKTAAVTHETQVCVNIKY